MMIALVVLATVAGLALLALWWIRQYSMATNLAGPGANRVAPACDIGQQLLMASAEGGSGGGTQTATKGGDAGGSAKGGKSAQGGGSGTAAPAKPKRRKPSGPSRRAFLRNSMAIGWLGVLGGFGGASLAFLWPSLRGGFGAQLAVDSEEIILEFIRENKEPFYYPQGRAYLIEYDPSLDPEGRYAELTGGTRVMALYQVCVHLGCRVPWCQTSQWFECPCHGSRYNRWGEYRGGPAPRGLDRFATSLNDDGQVVIDTSVIVSGPSRQVAVLDQTPEGPSCL